MPNFNSFSLDQKTVRLFFVSLVPYISLSFSTYCWVLVYGSFSTFWLHLSVIYGQTSILHSLPQSYDIQSSTLKSPFLKYFVLPLDNISVILLQNCTCQNMWSQCKLKLCTNTDFDQRTACRALVGWWKYTTQELKRITTLVIKAWSNNIQKLWK